MKIVCISDTHQLHRKLDVPNGTVLVHTGDFTNMGSEVHTDDFLAWFAEQPHKYKVLIAGNHDFFPYNHNCEFLQKCILLGITYLQDDAVTIEGIKFYGTPWVPRFYDWAFMRDERTLRQIYAQIPEDTQVLLTHGPALYTLDEVPRGHVGSEALKDRIEQLPNLTHHIFGHIHESGGKLKTSYTSVNAACVDRWYELRRVKSIYVKPNQSD